jgi:hypothetical protein
MAATIAVERLTVANERVARAIGAGVIVAGLLVIARAAEDAYRTSVAQP